MEKREEKILLLKEQLKRIDTRNSEESVRDLEIRIQNLHREIGRYLNYVNECYVKVKENMAEVEKVKILKQERDFTSDITAILNHPTVENMEVVIGTDMKKVIIFTDYIDIYDEDGNKYLGNKYKLIFDYRYMSVNIFGQEEDLNRQGYWTSHDPHPHVDGDGGYPCLGNAGSMLCLSMNEFELYASYIIILNFLQQVNTSDVAGKYIRNWDCVDENGEIIENPHETEMYTCYICDYETEDEENIVTCEDCGNTICYDCSGYVDGYGRVCEHCLNDGYFYCYYCNEYYSLEDDEVIYVGDEKYCKTCADDLFSTCDECGKYLRDKDKCEIDDMTYCDECYEKLTVTCSHCGTEVLKDNSFEDLDKYYCEDCWNEISEEEEMEGNV